MPRTKRGTPPTYRKHRPSGQAVVTLSGRDFYLGPHGTKVSRDEYDRVVSEWMANGRRLLVEAHDSEITVVELAAAYVKYAQQYHQRDGVPTGEYGKIRAMLGAIKPMYGVKGVSEFGPLALMAMQKRFVDAGQGRKYVNDNVGRIVRMFAWGVSRQLVPPDLHAALKTVTALRSGKTSAPEPTPVKPVPDEYVDAISPHVSPQVWAMVELQRLTGMRPGEVVIMRGRDLDMTAPVWLYHPYRHKTESHGHERIVDLGPHAQKIVTPFLRTDVTGYLFKPTDVIAESNVERRRNRQSPMTPSQRVRRPKQNPKRAPQDHYTRDSYRRAIQRACDKADAVAKEANSQPADAERIIPQWHPHQLRHNFATNIRKRFGIEAARILCGHKSMAVTEVYSEIDRAKVASIVAKVG